MHRRSTRRQASTVTEESVSTSTVVATFTASDLDDQDQRDVRESPAATITTTRESTATERSP
ncbi:hypothetical protein [Vibrio vulnificus]|uniref:hypothetical protein n=1 Tax=Vibrio vulnificus TaxID=672 RepID=UPI000AA89490|nr:hypothetical protein [Vibrio vulnificus]